MRVYRLSTNLKLGLITFASLIAIASLWVTTRLVDQLKEREAAVVQLWAQALEQIPLVEQQAANHPFPTEFEEMEGLLDSWSNMLSSPFAAFSDEDLERYRDALVWAQTHPENADINFLQEVIVRNTDLFSGIPAIVVDSSSGTPGIWRNVGVPESLSELSESEQQASMRALLRIAEGMAAQHRPIPIVVNFPETEFFSCDTIRSDALLRRIRAGRPAPLVSVYPVALRGSFCPGWIFRLFLYPTQRAKQSLGRNGKGGGSSAGHTHFEFDGMGGNVAPE